MADAISRVIECVTELIEAVFLEREQFSTFKIYCHGWENLLELSKLRGARDIRMLKARQVVASVLRHSCQEAHPAGFEQAGIGESSMHKHFWTQMAWLQSLVQTKGIFVSLCLLAQLWVSAAPTLWVAFGSGQILLFGDLFCFFLMLCKSTITTYTKERTCGEDNENQIHGCQIKRWKAKTF